MIGYTFHLVFEKERSSSSFVICPSDAVLSIAGFVLNKKMHDERGHFVRLIVYSYVCVNIVLVCSCE